MASVLYLWILILNQDISLWIIFLCSFFPCVCGVYMCLHTLCGYTWLCLIVWNPDVDVMMSFLNLCLLTLLFWDKVSLSLSLNPKLAIFTILFGQEASRILLSFLCWGYRHVPLCIAFKWGPLSGSFYLHRKHSIHWDIDLLICYNNC